MSDTPNEFMEAVNAWSGLAGQFGKLQATNRAVPAELFSQLNFAYARVAAIAKRLGVSPAPTASPEAPKESSDG